ncbi:MAG: maleylpyruvate isomerase [Syntrophorhabdaceae bacterium]
MSKQTGQQLADMLSARIDDFVNACEDIDESMATRAPKERWSPKQIVSHILGPEGPGITHDLKKFIDQDMPSIELEAENPFFFERRARMNFSELLTQFENDYGEIVIFVRPLTPEQLDRKARVPLLRDTDLGEYPTLEDMVAGLLNYHLKFHTDHMREIVEALKATS